ncbi:carbohydrate kinase [Streptomyces cellostaticus]|uniref:Carbohydrate kinase n=1 Tax=Streptomyces cellostaticus TaxID=67285 RepID=A0A101NJ74_9ACTN|nr:sugar kinase [Streptomyces cellostaticus]KUM94271.1 carbohydrate kinase [Streptomyces cellostaticus]GHI05324.1 carbohydrate kinase [Streptomyces cellostaticus]
MTVIGARNAPDIVDVVALGESMVTFLPTRPGRLADVPSFERTIGGAESNVACVLATAGHSARWVSRVGADGFGRHLVERIAGYGVDTSAVRTDATRPTGIYFRTAADRATDAHEVAYYRAGSAASAMAVDNVDLAAVRAGRVLHLSGITPALSEECLHLVRQLAKPAAGRPLMSFDVNYRPGLWHDPDGPEVLLELARGCDLVFVGTDEAEAAWGVTGGPETIRALLPEPRVLVVKEGARGATVFERDHGGERYPPAAGSRAAWGGTGGRGGTPQAPGCATHPWPTPAPGTFVPALAVDVVATVGAGDAFAAGFLSATLRGLPLRDRIRHGHLTAAATLTAPGDLAAPPTRSHADRLAALDDEAWGRLRLGPGWTQAEQATEEANTP